jgi:hypothetical protein
MSYYIGRSFHYFSIKEYNKNYKKRMDKLNINQALDREE